MAHASDTFKQVGNAILTLLLLTSCAFEHTPDIVPIAPPPGSADPPSVPYATMDHRTISIPDSGTVEELEYYASLIGFGSEGNLSIHEVFNPYLREDPLLPGSILSEPPENADEITLALYGSMHAFEQATQNTDNILNWQSDAMSNLEGEALLEMTWMMAGQSSRHNLALFLDNLGADRSLYWNYEPAWLQAKMEENPEALILAQFQLLQIVQEAPNNETFWWLQSLEQVGPEE